MAKALVAASDPFLPLRLLVKLPECEDPQRPSLR